MHHYDYDYHNKMETFNFQTRPPKQPVCGIHQNQNSKMADYKETIPNRRLTAKRGVFPYAIHANVVSKRENGIHRDPREKVQTNVMGIGNIPNEKKMEFARPFRNSIQTQTNMPPKTTNMPNQNHMDPPFPNIFNKPYSAQSTPFTSKKPTHGISAKFTNSSTTTEMNKNVLLNEYLTQQYNATVSTSASTSQMKHINFDPEEAFQICTYQKIGEVLNQSFITQGSANFHSSLEVTSAVQKKIQELYIERKKKDGKHDSSQTHDDNLKPVKHASNAFKSTTNLRQSKRDRPSNLDKRDIYEYDNFLDDVPLKKKPLPKFDTHRKISNHMLPDHDTLSPWKGNKDNLTKGNDCLSPVHNLTENTNDWCSSITISSGSENNDPISRRLYEKYDEFPVVYEVDSSPLSYNNDDLTKCDSYLKNFDTSNFQKNVRSEEEISPSLFFLEDSPISDKKMQARSQQAPDSRFFSFDSVVAKRGMERENEKLLNPIEFLKSTVGKSNGGDQKRKRRIYTPNPYYSDSTHYGVNPPTQSRKRSDAFYSKFKNYKTSSRKKKSLF